jgi:hypothetical protein
MVSSRCSGHEAIASSALPPLDGDTDSARVRRRCRHRARRAPPPPDRSHPPATHRAGSSRPRMRDCSAGRSGWRLARRRCPAGAAGAPGAGTNAAPLRPRGGAAGAPGSDCLAGDAEDLGDGGLWQCELARQEVQGFAEGELRDSGSLHGRLSLARRTDGTDQLPPFPAPFYSVTGFPPRSGRPVTSPAARRAPRSGSRARRGCRSTARPRGRWGWHRRGRPRPPFPRRVWPTMLAATDPRWRSAHGTPDARAGGERRSPRRAEVQSGAVPKVRGCTDRCFADGILSDGELG